SWFKTTDNTWNKWIANDLQKSIAFRALEVEIPLAAIYRRIF
ncbi:MAG: hypothetical protein RL329_86, partial [Bacteroidota bacterium]